MLYLYITIISLVLWVVLAWSSFELAKYMLVYKYKLALTKGLKQHGFIVSCVAAPFVFIVLVIDYLVFRLQGN